ncbi:type I restriction enzyme HsdR N-terminal domain-containing protein [Desulfothermus sp.]
MHEVKLGFKIKDYLTGKDIDATTYEDIRQDIVKIMVEEKSYPKDQIKSKLPIIFNVDQKEFVRNIDFVIFLENKPLAIILFCAGEIETYIREAVSLARLIEGGPARFSIVTDTKKFMLVCAKDGEILSQDPYEKFPTWQDILSLLDRCSEFTMDNSRIEKEKRILYALSQISCECRDSCNI